MNWCRHCAPPRARRLSVVKALPPIDQLLIDAAAVLAAGGIDEPRQEARRIWRDLAPDDRDMLIDRHMPLDPALADRFGAAIGRRARHEPRAYVTGRIGFRHIDLACDARALIPRPETEGLVALALSKVSTGRAADIGTGTGAIALSLASEGQFTEVIGTDASADALALARENGRRTGLAVTWREGDLVGPLAEPVDLLVSNPPYLTDAEYSALESAVKEWEPRLALASGPDGMIATRRLLEEGGQVLSRGGWLALEVDARRAAAVAAMARELKWQEIAVHDDLFGRPRFVLGRWEMRND